MTFSFNDNHDDYLNKIYRATYGIDMDNFNMIGIDPGKSNHYFYWRMQKINEYLKECYGLTDFYIRYEF